MKYYKDHDDWNFFKKILDKIKINLHFNEGEIWWISFGINLGVEIDGKGIYYERPALVVKKFNKDHAWIIPITTAKSANRDIYISINHRYLGKNSTAVVTQLQTVSNLRFLRKIGMTDRNQFIQIIKSIKDILPEFY